MASGGSGDICSERTGDRYRRLNEWQCNAGWCCERVFTCSAFISLSTGWMASPVASDKTATTTETTYPLFDLQLTLDSLPSLVSLTCVEFCHLTITQLLAIASHSTLEEVCIDTDYTGVSDDEWIGEGMVFPSTWRRMRACWQILS